jgi:hypothetical protein
MPQKILEHVPTSDHSWIKGEIEFEIKKINQTGRTDTFFACVWQSLTLFIKYRIIFSL